MPTGYWKISFRKLADIVLNLLYNPLGVVSSDWVVYEKHPTACKAKISKALRLKLECAPPQSVGPDVIYLYSTFEPKNKKFLAEYVARLVLLEKIHVLP